MKKLPNGYWKQWNHIEEVIFISMKDNHGLIPGRTWFDKEGYSSVLIALKLYWGLTLKQTRDRFGVEDKKFCKKCQLVKSKNEFRLKKKKNLTGGYHTFRYNICNKCGNKEAVKSQWTSKGTVWKICYRANLRAKRDGREFNLTKEWIQERLDLINWCCEVTGIPFKNEPEQGRGFGSPLAVSIDRIDNSRGYTTDNVRFVINWLNTAKGDLSDDFFMTLCRSVANRKREQ